MPMKVPPEEIKQIADCAPTLTRKGKRKSIDRMISRHRTEMRKQINERMQREMTLFDEALRFIIAFEEFIHSTMPNKSRSSLAMTLGRIRGDLVSIRSLIELGQESSALAVARVFLEDLEIAMACCIDPEFSDLFLEFESGKEFWSKCVGYGKIYPLVERFFVCGWKDEKLAVSAIQHHRNLKNFLSDYIHLTASVAMRATFPLALDKPGMLLYRPFRSISEFAPPICLYVADEIHAFSACCINIFISPEPPPALANFDPCGELDDVLAAAHVLQELVIKYSDQLWSDYQNIRATWNEAFEIGADET